MYLHRNEPTMEMISFNTYNGFGADVEAACAILLSERYITHELLEKSNLTKIIKKHTNITIRVNILDERNSSPFDFSIEYVILTGNHILLLRWAKEDIDLNPFLKKVERINGTVDIKRGRVGGDFGDLVHFLNIPKMAAMTSWTAGMMAAVILHEIGHVFTMFECLKRTLTTNFVLEEARRQLINVDQRDDRVAIVGKLAATPGLNNSLDLSALADAKTPLDQYVVVQAATINASRSDLGINIYDVRASEQLADQYAIRCGYGKELAKALHDIDVNYGGSSVGPVAMNTMIILMEILVSVQTLGLIFMIMPFIADDYKRDVYDTPRRRLEVIRNDLIASLKYGDVKKDKVSQLIQAIQQIEVDIKNTSEYREMFSWYMSLFAGANLRAINIQKTLEDLSNSRLNVSAKLLEMYGA